MESTDVTGIVGSFAITVLIPTRNRAALLRDTLASILAQPTGDLLCELIVVDDGSSDATPDVVAEAQSGPGWTIRYDRHPPTSPNAARNRGARAAKSRLIWFLDDDVAVPDGWLSAVLESTKANPEVACFGGPIRLRMEGPAPHLCNPKETVGETELDLGGLPREVDLVWGANFGIRRRAYEAVGPFNEELTFPFGDETEWLLRYKRAGGTVFYIPEAGLWHRRTADSLRLRRLCKVQFLRGVHNVKFYRITEQDVRMGPQLVNVARMLFHAAKNRCAFGLISASRSGGQACGLILERRTGQPSRRPK